MLCYASCINVVESTNSLFSEEEESKEEEADCSFSSWGDEESSEDTKEEEEITHMMRKLSLGKAAKKRAVSAAPMKSREAEWLLSDNTLHLRS